MSLSAPRSLRKRSTRKGGILVLSAFMMVVITAFVAFAVDMGVLCVARGQLQNSADASALAAAWTLLDDERLRGDAYLDDVISSARTEAIRFAAKNKVLSSAGVLQPNTCNHPQGDIVFGRFNGGENLSTFGNTELHNAVHVRVKRTAAQNGTIPLFFAKILGIHEASVTAEAVAIIKDGVVGFRPREGSGYSSLIPLTVSINSWEGFLDGDGPDDWDYDPEEGTVCPGRDGIPEMTLFNGDRNTPGNFGTLNITSGDQGTGDLQAEIRNGLSHDDLTHRGGELKLDPETGTLLLDGDPGVETPVICAAGDILGKPVSIPLYSEASGSGATTTYTIVGFAGVRVVHVRPTGNRSEILVQPAVVIDPSAVVGGEGTSYHVYQPAVLAR